MSNEKDTNDPPAGDDTPPEDAPPESTSEEEQSREETGTEEAATNGHSSGDGVGNDADDADGGDEWNDPDLDDEWDDPELDDGVTIEGVDDDGNASGDSGDSGVVDGPVDDGDIDELGSTVEVEGAEIADDPDEDDLLGGLLIDDTSGIEIPDRLVDQVIGQEHARDVIIKAAKQRRHVMMIGSPGTGKSMLAKAMSELLPKEELQDVLVYHNPDDGNKPKVRTVPAGKGEQIVDAHKEEARKRNQMRSLLMWIIIAVVLGYALIIVGQILIGIIAAGVVYLVFRYLNRGSDAMIPNLLVNNGDTKSAPFRDATGAHAGALLGDVRHDPFQSGGMETPSRPCRAGSPS